jgi:excisionase family DNA binding protein
LIVAKMAETKKKNDPLSIVALTQKQLTTTEASELTGYTRDHIGLLLRRGLITGSKRGRDLFINSESLHEYVKTQPRPGRKSR